MLRDGRTISRELDESQAVLLAAEGYLRQVDEPADQLIKQLDDIHAERIRTPTAPLAIDAVVQKTAQSIVTVHCADRSASGFVIRTALEPGYRSAILTSHHVVQECTYVNGPPASVIQGGVGVRTRLWAWDADNDLAFLFVGPQLPALDPAPPANVGDHVIAIGSPQGGAATVSTGVVLGVTNHAYRTSADAGPVQSGGPLLDRGGRVLGTSTPTHDRIGDDTLAAVHLNVAGVRSGQSRPALPAALKPRTHNATSVARASAAHSAELTSSGSTLGRRLPARRASTIRASTSRLVRTTVGPRTGVCVSPYAG